MYNHVHHCLSITGTENKNARTVHAKRECTSTDHKRLSTQGQIRPEQNTQELNAQREHKEEQSAEVTTEKNTQQDLFSDEDNDDMEVEYAESGDSEYAQSGKSDSENEPLSKIVSNKKT
ncbi:unnamed protein product [Parnassius apollo]|uniref:(apollo) hypothetical protein n=1 Tax=Parnassius apollo TaxID=110799 RepID=A0A8S3WSV9_PARAO|nr:unnamed protein product [Parnassius apollo]